LSDAIHPLAKTIIISGTGFKA